MKYVYPAIFQKEKKGYSVWFADVPGATQGETIEEAIDMASDCLGLALYDMEDKNNAIPKASEMSAIKVGKDQFVQFITADTDLQRKYFENKSVRKNVSLPEWMYLYGEHLGLNFSAVLQDALKQKFKVLR